MDDQFENVFARHNRHETPVHFDWTEAWRIAIALQVLFVALLSPSGQSAQQRHLPTKRQVAPMTFEEQKNLAFVLDWWREVIEARHTELAANYAAEDLPASVNDVFALSNPHLALSTSNGPIIDPPYFPKPGGYTYQFGCPGNPKCPAGLGGSHSRERA